MRFFNTSLRWRLTLLYVSLLAGVLILYAGWTSVSLLHNLILELDSGLERDMNTVEWLVSLDSQGRINLGSSDNDADYLLEVWSENGTLLYRTPQFSGESLGSVPDRRNIRKLPYRSLRLSDGRLVRIASRWHRVGAHDLFIRIALNEDPLWYQFKKIVYLLALGLPAAIIIFGITGFYVAKRALRPVGSMAHRAEQITANNLNERIMIENTTDELYHLGNAFNQTLSRLERSFGQIKSFTADAAHEFRTPLASMLNVGEVALQKAGDTRYYRDVVGSMLEEVNHLSHLVDVLLTLSRADAGFVPVERTEVPLFDLATESVELLAVLAEEKNQTIEIGGDRSLSLSGDRLILRQALIAIIHNAISYTPDGGTVHVWVGVREERIQIEISDTGPGIGPEHRSKIFERFYRIDKGRTRARGGAGLGLSIAKWAVETHGGSINLKSMPGSGCTFLVIFPAPIAKVGSG